MNNDLIGFTGAFLVLVGFLLNQINILKNSNIMYDFINFLGSFMLLIYALILQSVPFIIINTVWALFSLKDVLWFFLKNSKSETAVTEVKNAIDSNLNEITETSK